MMHSVITYVVFDLYSLYFNNTKKKASRDHTQIKKFIHLYSKGLTQEK